MNFFGHAIVASWSSRAPGFVLGAMLPDFASMAGLRLAQVDDPELARGVDLHHRTDDVFHASPIFCALMGEAEDWLGERGLARGPAMAVGHVGVELVLDGWLAAREDMSLYRAALELEVAPVRFRGAEDAGERLAILRDRLGKSPLPAGYADPEIVADRLTRILAPRPRLRLGADGQRLVQAWARGPAAAVGERAPELMAELRAALG